MLKRQRHLSFIVAKNIFIFILTRAWPSIVSPATKRGVVSGPAFGNGRKEEGEVFKKLYGKINIQHQRLSEDPSCSASGHPLSLSSLSR